MYSIIQDSSIHKRLDCVNIVLSFFFIRFIKTMSISNNKYNNYTLIA